MPSPGWPAAYFRYAHVQAASVEPAHAVTALDRVVLVGDVLGAVGELEGGCGCFRRLQREEGIAGFPLFFCPRGRLGVSSPRCYLGKTPYTLQSTLVDLDLGGRSELPHICRLGEVSTKRPVRQTPETAEIRLENCLVFVLIFQITQLLKESKFSYS